MGKFQRTAEALAVYDEGKAERDRQLRAIRTNDEFQRYFEVEETAVRLVQDAFVADTADVNPEDRARLVHPNDPWLRWIIRDEAPRKQA